MVKASDLRVGNLVYIPKTDQIATVCSVVEFIGVQVNKNVIFEPIPFNEIELIDITPRILKDFGFNRQEKGSVSHQFTYGENPVTKDWEIQLVWLMDLDNKMNTCFEKYPFYQNGYQEIRTVNQLQNLYHALTGSELKREEKIKEKKNKTSSINSYSLTVSGDEHTENSFWCYRETLIIGSRCELECIICRNARLENECRDACL